VDASAVRRSASPSLAADLPDRVGPYRILKRIARGGMGVVYLAQRDGSLATRPVALKVVRAGSAVEDVLTRFSRERAVLASLDHPNIARLLDAGESESGEPWFAMEFVEGLAIDDYCDAHRLELPARIELFRQVCDAVHHAHRNLVVHRDLKPRNILVTSDGTPKLLDFGIAKLLNPTLSARTDAPTAAGVQLMTPEYASPEQVRGDPISTASDVYSLGMVLYELLTGRRPYRFITREPREIERVVCDAEPHRPSVAAMAPVPDAEMLAGSLRGDASISAGDLARRRGTTPPRLVRSLRGDLDVITMMALRKEPQRRYASAEALGQDLRRHLALQPVIARPDTFLYRTSRFAARNRTAVVAAALVFAAIIAGAAATLWQAEQARDQRDAAIEAQRVADRRLDELRGVVRSMLTEWPDEVRKLSGATELRKKFADRAVQLLTSLRADLEPTPEQLLEMVNAYRLLAEVQAGRGGNLGDPAEARGSLDAAFELLEQARKAGADATTLDRYTAVLLLGRAGQDRTDRDRAAAEAGLRRAIEVLEALAARPAAGPKDRRLLAVALLELGELLERGDAEAARMYFDRSLKIRQDLFDAAPIDEEARRDLSIVLANIGRSDLRIGEPKLALESFRRSLSIRESLHAEFLSDRELRDVMAGLNGMDTALVACGRPDEAIDNLRRALEIAEFRAKVAGSDMRPHRDLHEIKLLLARRQAARGRMDEAERLRRAAVAHMDALQAKRPGDGSVADLAHEAKEVLADQLRGQKATMNEAVELYRSLIAALDAEAPVRETTRQGETASGDTAPRRASSPLQQTLTRIRLRTLLADTLVELKSLDEAGNELALARGELDRIDSAMQPKDEVVLARSRLALPTSAWQETRGDAEAAARVVHEALEAIRAGDGSDGKRNSDLETMRRLLQKRAEEIAAKRP